MRKGKATEGLVQQHLPKSGGSVVKSSFCASIKVCAWLTGNRFEIATFAKLQNVCHSTTDRAKINGSKTSNKNRNLATEF